MLPSSLHCKSLSRNLQPSRPVGQSDVLPVYITPLVCNIVWYRVRLLYAVEYLPNIPSLPHHPSAPRAPDIVTSGGVPSWYSAVTAKI